MRGPTRAEVGLGVEAGEHRGRVPGSTTESGLQHRDDRRRGRGDAEVGRPGVAEVAPGATTVTPGRAVAALATEPSAEPLSTTTSSTGPALVSASTDRTHGSSSAPAS